MRRLSRIMTSFAVGIAMALPACEGLGAQQPSSSTRASRLTLTTGIQLTRAQYALVRAINDRTDESLRTLKERSPDGRLPADQVEAIFIARAREIFRDVLTPAQRARWATNARSLVEHGNALAHAYVNP